MPKNNCEPCRQRKTKCDRTNPCTSCTKAGLHCVFVDRPKLPRGRNGGRRGVNNDLARRLQRLEGMLSGVVAARQPPSVIPNQEGNAVGTDGECLNGTQLNRYLGGDFWITLGSEVNGLKEYLQESSSEVEDDDDLEGTSSPTDNSSSSTSTAGPSNSNTTGQGHFNFILTGPQSLNIAPGLLDHPNQESKNALCNSYVLNVDPICKILHAPSIQSLLLENASYLKYPKGHPGVEALMFAIYYAAITADTEDFSKRMLRMDKFSAVGRYRFAVELSLSKANFLDSRDLVTLQALVLYTVILRNQEHGRQQSSLLAIVVQTARSFNLHRELGYQACTPFEAEMRRRLWTVIRLLDFYAALDRGTEPIILENGVNDLTKPRNINDQDISPDSPISPEKRDGITDTTQIVMASHCLTIAKRLNYHATVVNPPRFQADWQQRFDIASEFKEAVLEKIFPFLDMSIDYHTWLYDDAREMIGVLNIYALRPMSHFPGASAPPVRGDHILDLATDLLNTSITSLETPRSPRKWWFWVLWYTLAVALAELCERSTALDRTWDIVEKAFQLYSTRIADGRKGRLWQPMMRLRKKALSKRATFDATALDVPATDWTQGSGWSGNPHAMLPYHPHLMRPPHMQVNAVPRLPWALPTAVPDQIQTHAGDFGSDPLLSTSDETLAGLESLSAPPSDAGWTSWNLFVEDFTNFDQPSQNMFEGGISLE